MEYLKKIFSKQNLILYAIIIGLIFLDLLTKGLVEKNINYGSSVSVIENILSFTYILNTGGACGIFSQNNAVIILAIFSVVFALVFLMLNAFFIKNKNGLYYVCFCLILGGTIGNMIDRFSLHAVRDFIHLKFIDFPIFNFADICLVVGIIGFCLWYILVSFKKEKNKQE